MKIPATFLTLAIATSLAILSPSVASAADNDKAPAAAAVGVPADYPLKTCPVSGEALGEMGKPIKTTHEGTDVYLCCKGCLKDFNKDPGKYSKIVKDAAAKK